VTALSAQVEAVTIMSPLGAGEPSYPDEEPACFHDLNLDQVVGSLAAKRPDYPNLARMYHRLPATAHEVHYRQEVARDLEDKALRNSLGQFSGTMRRSRALLAAARKLGNRYYQQAWFLDGAENYCQAIELLERGLGSAVLRSDALAGMLSYVRGYSSSLSFVALRDGATTAREQLGSISYTTFIRNGRVTVDRYQGEDDYSDLIEAVFAKFREKQARDYRRPVRDVRDSNHVQGWVLDNLAQIYPEVFSVLAQYCQANANFFDPVVARFEQELQFYTAYYELVDEQENAGLYFCVPQLNEQPDSPQHVEDGFDIALAAVGGTARPRVVPNEMSLDPPERVIVVSGPNQGGKTTFARMFGQLYYLAALGLPVPARSARLLIADAIYTHFERPEFLEDLKGKLEDELVRVRDILSLVSERSVLVMNESFSSTSLEDNRFIGRHVLENVIAKRALCVYVTFVDELSRLGPAVTSYVSEVLPDDPSKRTFKVRRRPADGKAYARTLAQKYGVTGEQIKQRMGTP
jgi:DNA mismatch repair protein MutS